MITDQKWSVIPCVSAELAELAGQFGKTYMIRVRRWSGTESTWFGIAWTVTGGLLLAVSVEGLVAQRLTRL
jgi:hypothetical protein